MTKKTTSKTIEANSDTSDRQTVNILGVRVSISDMSQVLNIIERKIENKVSNKPLFVVTINQEIVMLAQSDEAFMTILNAADLAVADGVGLRLAQPELKIVRGRELVERLATMRSYRIFYLGGRGGVAKTMTEMYGGAGDEGEKSIRTGEQESKRIIDKINKYRPDILMVAYGAPWQERWIWRHRAELKAQVVIGVGGAFDYLTGRAKLPPEWMAKLGLEWLWRLVYEPARWRRQLNLVKFVWLVVMRSLKG